MDESWAARFATADPDLTDVYESIMVPRLFAPLAEVLADALDAGATVVDVATGPGTVARALARRLGASGRVVGCDVSAGMLAAAQQYPAEPGAAVLEYVQCAADELSLPDATAAGVTCQHGLQFFPDRVAALAEMRRVVRPGGRLVAAVWAPIEQSALFSAVALGVATVFGADAARAYVAGPWALTDAAELAGVGVAAGWCDVEVVPHEFALHFEGGAAQLVATLGVTPLGPQVAGLDARERDRLIDAVSFALGDALQRDGAAAAPETAHLLLARR